MNYLYRAHHRIRTFSIYSIKHHRAILTTFRRARFETNGETNASSTTPRTPTTTQPWVHYAPIAARQAATLGAHIEAARLYHSAIEYYQGEDPDILVGLHNPSHTNAI